MVTLEYVVLDSTHDKLKHFKNQQRTIIKTKIPST